MDATTFLLVTGLVLVFSIAAGIRVRPPPEKEPPPPEEIHRWAVFRLHLDRVLGGEGPVLEALPGKPLLVAKGPPSRKVLRLAGPDGKERVSVHVRRLFRRHVLRIRLDRRPLAELRSRKGEGLGEMRSRVIDFDIAGDTQSLELELRREGRLLASVSPEIAPHPGSVGVEVLASADPMPVLAVVAALGFLRELTVPPDVPQPAAP